MVIRLLWPFVSSPMNASLRSSMFLSTASAIVLLLWGLLAPASVESKDAVMKPQDIRGFQSENCRDRFTRLVRELDLVLAGDPTSVDPIQDVIGRNLPINGCSIEELRPIAEASRFYVTARESQKFHSISFNNEGISKGYGFAVMISLNKKTGELEMPFTRPNRY